MAGNTVAVFACAAAATGLGPLPRKNGKGQPAAIGVGQRRSLKRSQPGAHFTRCNMSPIGPPVIWPATLFQNHPIVMQRLSASRGISLAMPLEEMAREPLHSMAEIDLPHIIHGTRTATSADKLMVGAPPSAALQWR